MLEMQLLSSRELLPPSPTTGVHSSISGFFLRLFACFSYRKSGTKIFPCQGYSNSQMTNNNGAFPAVNSNANPADNPNVDPAVNPSVDPAVNYNAYSADNPSVDPADNPSVDSAVNSNANPADNPNANPAINPSVDPAVNPSVHPVVNPNLVAKRKPVVLIVDDVALNRKMLRRLLTDRCAQAVEAVDGQDAVGKVRAAMVTGGEMFDIITMDYQMPVMDGVTATQHIRQLGYTGIIVGVTGNALPADVSRFILAGANRVLTKPMDVKKMDDVIRVMYSSWE